MKNIKAQTLRARFIPAVIVTLLVGVPAQAAAAPPDNYPQTRQVLMELVTAGHAAVMHYRQSARQARSEKLPYIADLFKAMAASQVVMTRNFEVLLTELDGPVSACAPPRIAPSTTRRNLIAAIQNEIRETDETYPRALERIRHEGHATVVAALQQVIQSQQLRRHDMQKIRRGARHFYGLLKSEVRRRATTYYICQQSGTMLLDELPAICPVRGASTASYRGLHRVSMGEDLRACQPGAAPSVSEAPRPDAGGRAPAGQAFSTDRRS